MLTKDQVDALFRNLHGVDCFHDALAELENRKYTDAECRAEFEKLPGDIQFAAFEWGLSDTVVRDAAYVFLKQLKENKCLN